MFSSYVIGWWDVIICIVYKVFNSFRLGIRFFFCSVRYFCVRFVRGFIYVVGFFMFYFLFFGLFFFYKFCVGRVCSDRG